MNTPRQWKRCLNVTKPGVGWPFQSKPSPEGDPCSWWPHLSHPALTFPVFSENFTRFSRAACFKRYRLSLFHQAPTLPLTLSVPLSQRLCFVISCTWIFFTYFWTLLFMCLFVCLFIYFEPFLTLASHPCKPTSQHSLYKMLTLNWFFMIFLLLTWSLALYLSYILDTSKLHHLCSVSLVLLLTDWLHLYTS